MLFVIFVFADGHVEKLLVWIEGHFPQFSNSLSHMFEK